jgi:hypothetical protein
MPSNDIYGVNSLPLDQRPHSVYKFFDASGQLLYVGITNHALNRWSSHATTKTWWNKVVSSTIEHYPSQSAAREAEKTAIRVERPLHNRQHNRPTARATPSPRIRHARPPRRLAKSQARLDRLQQEVDPAGRLTADMPKYLNQVDPDGRMNPDDRERAAHHAVLVDLARLKLAAIKARKARKELAELDTAGEKAS